MSETPFFDAVKNIGDRQAAAQAMLKALRDAVKYPSTAAVPTTSIARAMREAIAQALAAGITTGDNHAEE